MILLIGGAGQAPDLHLVAGGLLIGESDGEGHRPGGGVLGVAVELRCEPGRRQCVKCQVKVGCHWSSSSSFVVAASSK